MAIEWFACYVYRLGASCRKFYSKNNSQFAGAGQGMIRKKSKASDERDIAKS